MYSEPNWLGKSLLSIDWAWYWGPKGSTQNIGSCNALFSSQILTGWGVAFGSVDFTCRCVIIACRRSLSFASWTGERIGKSSCYVFGGQNPEWYSFPYEALGIRTGTLQKHPPTPSTLLFLQQSGNVIRLFRLALFFLKWNKTLGAGYQPFAEQNTLAFDWSSSRPAGTSRFTAASTAKKTIMNHIY